MDGSQLYVKNLHPDVTEAMLRTKFSTAGPILSLKLERDALNFMNHAYVIFKNPADAKRALQQLNNVNIKGRPMRIVMDDMRTSVPQFENANIFIKNLPTSMESQDLHDVFSYFGEIISWQLSKDEFGFSRGYGFVQFETEEAGASAIQHLNGRKVHDEKELYVAKFKCKADRMKEKEANFTNLFVKNFGNGLNDQELEDLFKKYGEITSCKVKTDKEGNSLGFGFVNFQNPESSKKAVQEMHGAQVKCSDGSTTTLYVARHQPKAEREERLQHDSGKNRNTGVNLYVKNLHESVDDARLKKMFSPFGTITSAKVMKGDDGKSKCFGFVSFSCLDEAAEAISGMHGQVIASKNLYVSFAQSKEERKAQLSAQRQRRSRSEHRRPPNNRHPTSPMFQPGFAPHLNLPRPIPVHPGRVQAVTGVNLFPRLAIKVPPQGRTSSTPPKADKGKKDQKKGNAAVLPQGQTSSTPPKLGKGTKVQKKGNATDLARILKQMQESA